MENEIADLFVSAALTVNESKKNIIHVIKIISYLKYIFYYRFTLTTHRFINKYMGTRLRVPMKRSDMVKIFNYF